MKRLNDSSDVPEARLRILPKKKKLKEKDNATFYSPAEEWVLPVVETKDPEEREFVVDSGASSHMVSKKDLNSSELETMRTSRSPSTVMTANGEVQTREEATVYVKQVDLFVKVMFLEERHLQFFHSGSSSSIMGFHTTGPAVKKHISPKMARELIAISQTMHHRSPWFIDEFFLNYTFTYFFIIFITGFCI